MTKKIKENFFWNWNNGDSILIKNWDKTNKYLKSKEFIKSVEAFSLFRGRILSISTSIENLLWYCIEYVLFDEKNNTTELFQKLFLKTTYLWFHWKRKIFKELLKESYKTKDYYDKKIITEIQKCIEFRNKLAHWMLLFDCDEKKFYLESSLKELEYMEISNDDIKIKSENFYNCINKINCLVYWKSYSTVKMKMT